ncbi:Asp/Glu/Hydantoin racemase [Polaromonas sp. CF318]|uniref:aspartate/glutamate racemase family protein n=1 Tax=Polaromonas sp. CF318 TaxID=1144318 RepID=UPI0002711F9C|nr:aspartate/glutamate racemase family protein [Polaromonas sp. CF318]EJL77867.1 Asp/Glu/Hydantoin racemase [Polaromonas sp. CF318]
MNSRIALIHATPLAIAPIEEAFKRLWPTATTMNLLDGSLSADLAQGAVSTEAFTARFLALSRYAASTGAEAVLFTCSAFGSALDEAKKTMSLPSLKPNEAMFAEALAHARGKRGRIGLLTTFLPATQALESELRDDAGAAGMEVEVIKKCVPEALDALNRGDADTHDRLLKQAALEMGEMDVLMLGQFSMARASTLLRECLSYPVLTSPDSAVSKLKSSIESHPRHNRSNPI